jgi:hypothetical protein
MTKEHRRVAVTVSVGFSSANRRFTQWLAIDRGNVRGARDAKSLSQSLARAVIVLCMHGSTQSTCIAMELAVSLCAE